MNRHEEIKQTADEEAIISQIKGGNDFVLKRVYKDNFLIIKKLVLSNSGDEEDAKDLYQEAFMVFYQKIKSDDFVLKSSIKTFLYSVSRNLWLKRLRLFSSRDIVRLKEEDEFTEEENEIDYQSDSNSADVSVLSKCLEKIGEPCKTILMDFFYHKKSMEEIAQKMNYTNAANAKNQKYKCFNRLKKMFLVESRTE